MILISSICYSRQLLPFQENHALPPAAWLEIPNFPSNTCFDFCCTSTWTDYKILNQIIAMQRSGRYRYEKFGRSSSEQSGQKGYSQKKSKSNGYVSYLFSALRRNQSERKSTSKDKLSTSRLKQELQNLGSNLNQMAPGKIRSNMKQKKRISLSLTKQKGQSVRPQGHPEITSKNLKDYTKYIESKVSYCTQVNYNWLRRLQKTEGFEKVDMKEYKIVESTTLCLIDALNGDQPCSESLILEYCSLYFQSEERRKFQVVINYHVFKSFSLKIKTVYAYARLWYYFVAKLAENRLVFMAGINGLALSGCRLVDRLMKCLNEAVAQSLSRSSTTILQAFKSLKTVKQIQKIIKQFEGLVQTVEALLGSQQNSLLATNHKFYSDFTEIYTNLKPFLNEASFYNLEEYLSRVQIVLSWKYLKIPPVPYLPEKNNLHFTSNRYTLVMGLNKVIVLYNHSTRVLKYRPYMDTFLSRLSQCFEIVVFSDFDKPLTDRIIKEIEKEQAFFSVRLYHDHMSFKNGRIAKDISKLGRSMNDIIFLDTKQYLSNWEENEMAIPEYKVNAISSNNLVREKTLLAIMNKLIIVQKQYPCDVRRVLKKTSDLCHIPEAASIEECSISISKSTLVKKQSSIF